MVRTALIEVWTRGAGQRGWIELENSIAVFCDVPHQSNIESLDAICNVSSIQQKMAIVRVSFCPQNRFKQAIMCIEEIHTIEESSGNDC